MKKILLALALSVATCFADGLVTVVIPNTTNWTTACVARPVNVYRVDVASTTANLLSFYDSPTTNINLATGSYVRSTNIWFTNTWIQTNAIFEYATSTQVLTQLMTQIGQYRTNITVAAATNQLPAQGTLFVPAGTSATFDNIDLNFTRGMAATSTNACTVIIYTRN